MEGRRKTRGSLRDGPVGAQSRCLILFLEEDQKGRHGRGDQLLQEISREKKLILCECV